VIFSGFQQMFLSGSLQTRAGRSEVMGNAGLGAVKNLLFCLQMIGESNYKFQTRLEFPGKAIVRLHRTRNSGFLIPAAKFRFRASGKDALDQPFI
jgi:hypothetical protein